MALEASDMARAVLQPTSSPDFTRESTPSYTGMSDADRTERAHIVLEILRRLDTASLDEVIVLERCLDQIEALRAGTADRCLLARGVLLELTNVRLGRPLAQPQRRVALDAALDAERVCVRQLEGAIKAISQTIARFMPGPHAIICMWCDSDLGGEAEAKEHAASCVKHPAVIALRARDEGHPGAATVAQGRLRRARELAGITMVQATSLLGYSVDQIIDWETERATPSTIQVKDMAAAYGVSLKWLQGAPTVIEPGTARMLHDADISHDDRTSITALLETIEGAG